MTVFLGGASEPFAGDASYFAEAVPNSLSD
jgi:hypothetical protein